MKTTGPTSFHVARKHVDYSCEVSEKMIAIAVLRLIELEKLVVEGGGAAALAAILPGGPLHGKFAGKKVVVPLCGGNIDTTVLGRVIDRGLAADQRLVRFSATVSDRPGGIATLSRDMADMGVSVKVRTPLKCLKQPSSLLDVILTPLCLCVFAGHLPRARLAPLSS
jgi:threonine dehydratase